MKYFILTMNICHMSLKKGVKFKITIMLFLRGIFIMIQAPMKFLLDLREFCITHENKTIPKCSEN